LRQLIRGLALMWPRCCFRPELRYLPSYSPDFNPIEQFFAKLKALLRKVAARTIEALIAAIAEALTKVSPQECENYLANQGYRRQL
jgi:transposase